MEDKIEPSEQLKKLILYFDNIEKEKYWGEVSLTFRNGEFKFLRTLKTGTSLEEYKNKT